MKSKRPIRIATRSSPLALWQANTVKQKLETTGNACELILIKSVGDIEQTQPIYTLGITGVFTKQLDIALLEDQADIAVHSLKDVPTQLAKGLKIAAVLERGSPEDMVIVKHKEFLNDNCSTATIASSSLRRKAQWNAKYPHHQIVPVRGNVETRIGKFKESAEVDGIIFAKAGLERLGLLNENTITLHWMLPAPAQGIIGIICKENDEEIIDSCKEINHIPSFYSGFIERQFMSTLQAGCSVPVSAWANIVHEEIIFTAAIHAFDGKREFRIHQKYLLAEWESVGKTAAENLLLQPGAEELLTEIKRKNVE